MATKHLLIAMFMVFVMAFSVSAGGLEFKNVEADVDGEDSDDLDDGDRIRDEAQPGSEVKISVEVESNFTNSDFDADGDDIEIQDIEVTITIEGIDDGDEIEEDFELDDLGPGDDDQADIEFTVPLEAGDGDYDVTIEVEGEDTNGTTHTLLMNLILEVEKEKHEVRITRNMLTPEEVKCSRSAQIAVNVINTGEEDEEDVQLTVSNEELGVNFQETFDIDEGDFDDDMEFSKVFSFSVAKEVASGVYPIMTKVVYDDGGETETETADLSVSDCETSTSTTDDDVADADSDSDSTTGTADDDTTVIVGGNQPGTVVADVLEPSETTTESGSLLDRPGFLAGVIALEVIVVLLGIGLVVYLLRR